MHIPLSWQILLATVLATIVGNLFPALAGYAALGTELYIRILSLILIPYVFFGIINALTKSAGNDFAGRVILKNLSHFVMMEMVAIVAALIVGNVFFQARTIELQIMPMPDLGKTRDFGDIITNMLPESLIGILNPQNLLALIITACIIGLYANTCNDKTRLFLSNLSGSASDVMIRITNFVAAISPVGIFCAVSKLATDGDVLVNIDKIKPLAIAVVIALGIHAIITIPIYLKITTGSNPYRFMKMFGSVLFAAMGFSSSVYVMPLAINRLKQESGISSKIADFSMPVISILNYNGTSIFLSIGALYIAHSYGINLSIIEQIILMFAVSFVTIGTVACPLRLSLIIYPVLESMGIPLEGMGVLILCDIVFGIACSVVDTWSNIAITASVGVSEGDKLKTDIEI